MSLNKFLPGGGTDQLLSFVDTILGDSNLNETFEVIEEFLDVDINKELEHTSRRISEAREGTEYLMSVVYGSQYSTTFIAPS